MWTNPLASDLWPVKLRQRSTSLWSTTLRSTSSSRTGCCTETRTGAWQTSRIIRASWFSTHPLLQTRVSRSKARMTRCCTWTPLATPSTSSLTKTTRRRPKCFMGISSLRAGILSEAKSTETVTTGPRPRPSKTYVKTFSNWRKSRKMAPAWNSWLSIISTARSWRRKKSSRDYRSLIITSKSCASWPQAISNHSMKRRSLGIDASWRSRARKSSILRMILSTPATKKRRTILRKCLWSWRRYRSQLYPRGEGSYPQSHHPCLSPRKYCDIPYVGFDF